MQTSHSYNAGYRLGQFVRPLFVNVREVLASSTERLDPHHEDYSALAATPTMVRRGVDLANWQARNLRPIDEPISAKKDAPMLLLCWDGNSEIVSDDRGLSPAPSFLRSKGPRSSLDALI